MNPEEKKEEIRPITFFTDALLSISGNWLYRLNANNLWEESANDEVCEYGGNNIGMDEDLIVNISEDQRFVSLQPGGSWTFSYPMDHPNHEAIGDAFSYQFKGATLEWWDWGDLEAHANRMVKVQSWLSGGGYEPPSNPLKLVVPASNGMQFTVVG